MKLLLDENGNVVVRNGMPVYVNDDGKEVEVDAPRLFSKITDLNAENKSHREKAKDLKAKLSIFDGIEDLSEYKKTADEAIESVANFTEKDLIEAGKVDEIKSAMAAAHQQEIDKLKKSFELKETSYKDTISSAEVQIRKLTIGSAFKASKFFVGDDSVTLLPPDAAEALFGAHFELEGDGDPKIVGYYDRNGKEMIYGSSSPGDAASFDEAIESLLDRYPDKDRILRSGKSGSGNRGGHGNNNHGGEKTNLDKLKEQHDALKKAGRISEAIAIKNRIHRVQSASA